MLAVSQHTGNKLELYDRLSDLGQEWTEKYNTLLDEQDDEEDSTIEYEEDDE